MGALINEAAPPFYVTERAAAKVKQLLATGDHSPEAKLRVYVSGGGCSGFQYGFEFDEAMVEGDLTLEVRGITVLIDPMSLQYLMGAELDFKEDLMASQFVINNPNAATTCGCGSSFAV